MLVDNLLIRLLLLLTAFLAGCASSDSRYRDNTSLERPPELPVDIQSREGTAEEPSEITHRRHGKGLGQDVYRLEDTETVMKIKRSFDEAWSLLDRVILERELKVTDKDRSKGTFYIAYDGGSLLGYSLFKGEGDTTYLINVEAEGSETKVTVSLAKKEEQTDLSALKDGAPDTTADSSERLFELLFDSLHDDVKQDPAF